MKRRGAASPGRSRHAGIGGLLGTARPTTLPGKSKARLCPTRLTDLINSHVRTAVTHAYPDRTIHLTLIDCEPAPGAEPTALEHSELGWYTPAEMPTLDFCPADAELLPVVFPDSKKL